MSFCCVMPCILVHFISHTGLQRWLGLIALYDHLPQLLMMVQCDDLVRQLQAYKGVGLQVDEGVSLQADDEMRSHAQWLLP